MSALPSTRRKAPSHRSVCLRGENLETREMLSGNRLLDNAAAALVDRQLATLLAAPLVEKAAPLTVVARLAADRFEVDNTTAQAKTIATNNAAQSHTLHNGSDVDWVRFSLSRRSTVTLETNGAAGDTLLHVFGNSGAQIGYDDDSGNGYFSRLSLTLDAGTYYARVSEYGANDAIAAYTLKVGAAVVATPAGDAYEVDNARTQAKAIATNGAVQTHSLHVGSDVDFVSFTLAQRSAVTIETNGSAGDTQLWLYNSAGTQVAYDDDNGNGYFSKIDRAGSSALDAGTYYAKVGEYGSNGTISSYTIAVRATVVASGVDFFNYVQFGGGWWDAEKSPTDNDDNLLCWAASTANVLAWTGWGQTGGMSTSDQIFAYFQNHWTDAGNHAYYGLDWWFDGVNNSPTGGDWAAVNVAGGGFFKSQNIASFMHYDSDDATIVSTLGNYLHAGYGTALGLAGGGGHQITCWGIRTTGATVNGVWVSDSDDDKGSTNPPDRLRYYDVVQTSGRWHLQNYYGSNNWYITDVVGMARRPAGANAGVDSLFAAATMAEPVDLQPMFAAATSIAPAPINFQPMALEPIVAEPIAAAHSALAGQAAPLAACDVATPRAIDAMFAGLGTPDRHARAALEAVLAERA